MSRSDSSASDSVDWIKLSPEEWQARLTREQYQVARKGGTERAFTGAYWNHKAAGMYCCV
ncbi:MAG TPA: peptide-methionine (R)-S-oxide reductase, partial [Prochlorococcus sp.]|nr:peptide-methionine (R)-S-oxide reductase [Prochlorococcus sp.]